MKKQNNLKWLVVAALTASGSILLCNVAHAAVNADTKKAASQIGASDVAEVSFSKESVELSDSAKKELQDIIAEAQKKGEIKEVRVAAWADQEYPGKGTDLAASQIQLAEKRAEGVQTFLENNLNVKGISTINMAERPSKIQDALKTPSSKTKHALEKSGAAPTQSSQTGFLGLKGKASQAVVMIYIKK